MELNSFIAHSFASDDADLVRTFLEFFDHVRRLIPGFTWDHAEEAEPKLLSQKVREKMEDKNLFIGICTPKELAVTATALSRPFLAQKKLCGQQNSFEHKTSDWLLQEIGYAVGKGMRLIILLEEGTRQPGGIQGDMEYVPFNRDAPQASFNKILEMLTTLAPQDVVAPPLDHPVAQEPESPEPVRPEAPQLLPQADWTLDQYFQALFYSIVDGDTVKEEQVSAAFLASPLSQPEEDRLHWHAERLRLRLLLSKEGSLDQLIALQKTNPESPTVAFSLASAYDGYGEHSKAAEMFEHAASRRDTSESRTTDLTLSAVSYAKAGNIKRATSLTDDCRNALAESPGYSALPLLKALVEIGRIRHEHDLFEATTEAVLQTEPENHDLRFSLAHHYSEVGRHGLALYHYNLLTARNPSGGNWNNLGVAADRLKLPCKAVRAYRAAEDLGETLAMSNLAQKYIDEGFIADAQLLIDKAIQQQNYDRHLGNPIARIRSAVESEEKAEAEVLEGVQPRRLFTLELANGLILPPPASFSAKYKGPVCELALRLTYPTLLLTGSYNRQRRKGFPFIPQLANKPDDTVTVHVRYEGSLAGKGATYKKWEKEGGGPPSPQTDPSATGIMILCEDLRLLRLLETPPKNGDSQYEIRLQE